MTDPHQRDLCAPQGHRLHKTRFWVYYDLWEQVINSPAVNISFMPREDGYSGNGWTLRVGSLLCRPLTRTGKLQCGTIPPSSRCKYGSNQQKNVAVWIWECQRNKIISKSSSACVLEELARCKSKANCVLHRCTDLNLSAFWGTPFHASEAHDWGIFICYNSTGIHLV